MVTLLGMLECDAHEYDTWFLTHVIKHNPLLEPLTNAPTALYCFLTEFLYPKVTGAFLIDFIILISPAALMH